MKKLLLWLLVAVSIGCNNNAATETAAADTTVMTPPIIVEDSSDVDAAHSSENALDWNGTYSGTLPCADCEGIETQLQLNTDKTYYLRQRYLGKESSTPQEYTGSFSFTNNGSTIQLQGIDNAPNQFKVGENKLIQLDLSGNSITGDLAAKYELKKQ